MIKGIYKWKPPHTLTSSVDAGFRPEKADDGLKVGASALNGAGWSRLVAEVVLESAAEVEGSEVSPNPLFGALTLLDPNGLAGASCGLFGAKVDSEEEAKGFAASETS